MVIVLAILIVLVNHPEGRHQSSQRIRSAAICVTYTLVIRSTQRIHDIPYAVPSQYGPVLNYYLLMQHKHLYATQVSTDGRQRDSAMLAMNRTKIQFII